MVRITEFTDPACPFAFSAEPALLRLRWLYGDQVDWSIRQVVLSESPEEYIAKGLNPQMMSAGFKNLQEEHGMPIDFSERTRMHGTAAAARAIVATRLHAPAHERRLLRALRVRTMGGALLDEQSTIDRSARDAGLDPAALRGWTSGEDVAVALKEDRIAARRPSSAALALSHKLASTGEDGGQRYTCPSLEFLGGDGRRIDAPGFQPFAVYEAAMANVAPELERRPVPESVAELLAWAEWPLATVEVAAVMDITPAEARLELARVAHFEPVGGDGYWSLEAAEQRIAA